jgi:DNA helicase HerA-like ATPase
MSDPTEKLQEGSGLNAEEITNRELGPRMVFAHPPEPPAELLLSDPLDSIYIGKTRSMNVPFCWTYENLTNPHIAVVGVTGSGKSYLVKTFLTRAAMIWKTNALIIDWASEYVDWVEHAGGKVIVLGEENSLNLMDLGGNSPINRVRQIMRSFEILSDLKARDDEKRVLEEALEEAYAERGFVGHEKNQDSIEPPTLKDVERILLKKAKRAESVWIKEYILNTAKLVGRFTKKGMDYFARQSSLKLTDLTKSGLVDIVLKNLPDEDFRMMAGLSILQYLKERMRDEGWSPTKGLRLFVVLDEAWKIAKDERSDAIMIVREGRKYQFGLIVASQNPTDINEAIFSNVGTTFVMNLKFERYKEYVRRSLNYSDYIAEAIEKFGVGDAAVNLAFSTKTDFPRTFLLKKVDGEEPLFPIVFEIGNEKISMEKGELRKRLLQEDVPEKVAEELLKRCKEEKKLHIQWLVNFLEHEGLSRSRITDILDYLGLEMESIRKLYMEMREGHETDNGTKKDEQDYAR